MRTRIFLVLVIALAAIVVPASAADLNWYGNGSVAGGPGTWNTTATNKPWSVDGATFKAWSNTNPDNAFFAGATGGTVTLGAAVTVGNMTFNTTDLSAYTFTGGSILALGTAGTITTTTDAVFDSTTIVTGTNGFTKAGAGALTLSGANTLAGGAVTLSAGTLNLNHVSALGGTATTPGTTVLNINGGALGSTAAGNLVLYNSGAVNINSDFSSSVTAGKYLSLGTGAVTLSTDHTITVTQGTLSLPSGTLSGGKITKQGAGTLTINSALTLDNNNSFIVQGGNLTLNGTSTTFDGSILFNSMPAGTTLGINYAASLGAAPSALSINSNFTINNTGVGDITIAGNPALTIGSDFAFGGSTGINMGTGAISLTTSPTITTNGTTKTLTLAGPISGAGQSITKAGTGLLAISGAIGTTTGGITVNNGTLTLSGANTFTGPVTLNGGTLKVNNANALGATSSTSTLTIAGGTLDNSTAGAITLLNALPQTWSGDFTFTGTQNLNLGTGAVTITGSSPRTVGVTTANSGTVGNLTVGGNITSADIALTKVGAGRVTVTGNLNTGAGAVNVSAGSLILNGPNNVFGSLNLSGTGVVGLNGACTFGGDITIPSGTQLSIGNTSAIPVAGKNIIFTGTTGNAWLAVGATMTLNNPNMTWSASNIGFSGYGFTENLGTGAVSMTTDVTLKPAVTSQNNYVIVGGNVDSSDHSTLHNLTVSNVGSGGGTMTFNGTVSHIGMLTINNATTVSFNNAASNSVSITGLTIGAGTSGGSIGTASAITLPNPTITLNANFSNSGTGSLNLGTGNVTLGSTALYITGGATGGMTVGGNIQATSTPLGFVGNVTLSGDNSGFTGGLFLGNEAYNHLQQTLTLTVGSATALGNPSAITMRGDTTINSNYDLTLGTIVKGGAATNTTYAMTKSGTGTLTIGSSTVPAKLTLSAGGLRTVAPVTLPGQLIVPTGSSTSIATGSDLTVPSMTTSGTTGNTTVTMNGNLTVNGALYVGANIPFVKAGTGTLTLNGATTSPDYASFSINGGGTLVLNNANAIRPVGKLVSFNIYNGTTLDSNADGGNIPGGYDNTMSGTVNFTGSNPMTFNNDPNNVSVYFNASTTVNVLANTVTFGGIYGKQHWPPDAPVVSTLTKTGAGTLTLSGANTSTSLFLTAGTLNLNNAAAVSSTGISGGLTISGGTIDTTAGDLILANHPEAWNGDFAFKGTNNLNINDGAVTLGASNVNLTVTNNTLTANGIIGGAGNGLTKLGAGTLVLTKVNTYDGTTAANAGILAINAGASIAGPAVVGTNGTMNVLGTAKGTLGVTGIANVTGTVVGAATVNGGGNLTVNSAGKLSSTLDVTGTANVTGTVTGAATALSGGTLTVNGGGILSSTLGVTGIANVTGSVVGAATVNNGGTLNVITGGALGSTLDVTGIANVTGTVTGAATALSGGTLNVNTGGILSSTLAVTGTATVTGAVSGLTTVNAGGALNGPGSFAGIVSSGTVAPKGAMLSSSDVVLSGGAFQVNLAANNSSDSLAVTGLTTLGGNLVVTTTAGYTPAKSDTWTILTSTGGFSGSFSNVPSGYVATVTGTNLVLSVAKPTVTYKQGDADTNGIINGDDMAAIALNWDPNGVNRATNSWSMGDFDNNGLINGDDMAFVAMNWAPGGYALSSDVAAPPVPEPVTMTLLAIGALGMLARRNRR